MSVNELDEIKTSVDYNNSIKKNPSLNYINFQDLIIKNDIPTIEGLKILITHFNFLRAMYAFAAIEDEKFHKNFINIGIVIGWGVNIFTIVVTSYENDIPLSLITMINSIGNLVSVIIVTVINFYIIQSEIIEYKRNARTFGRLSRSLSLDINLISNEENRYENLFKKYYGEYCRIIEEGSYDISNKTHQKFYKHITINLKQK